MDFVTVEGRSLRDALKCITPIVERRNTIPILGTLLLEFNGNALIITGTDLDMEMRVDIDVIDGDGAWKACLSADTLSNIARLSGASPVRISVEGDKAKLSVGDGDASYEIPTMPVSDFPLIEATADTVLDRFGNGSISDLLSKVAWCISTEETRYYLNGVCWQSREDGHVFVATDGHRLSVCRYDQDAVPGINMIIPRKAVTHVVSHFRGRDVEIFSTSKPLAIDIVSPGRRLRTKLIDGTFPDWTRVVPKSEALQYKFEITPAEIDLAVQRAQVFGEANRAVEIKPKDGKLAVARRSPDCGTAEIQTSATWPEGATSFGFNAKYLREVLATVAGPTELLMQDASAPFMVADMDKTMTRVIMPMRV
ncbi:DNA polymerase III subunit beta [Aminobacter ciceronei]|uniref:Beta sliding clamp n=1 Tax=Aminobacter ciceronei TaxID=150723 RepID=A0ABR6C1W0_9HYPH|nr:DNA polymerase III subunit beta [Aminobacter ciceronei]MBA8904846.1 DNA polymerase-3 subunit beta [Aminobacter ciceronei]MBA9018600.1 DNA polymerase-3 subunit beta [Aminobacter ciceronei]